jgi:hypothetical protein
LKAEPPTQESIVQRITIQARKGVYVEKAL